MTALEARKVRSVIALHTPKIHESVSVGAGVRLEFDRDQGISIHSAVDYYWQLRIPANGWAWAGNYVMQYEGAAHWMVDLSQATLTKRSGIAWSVGEAAWDGCSGMTCLPEARLAHMSAATCLWCRSEEGPAAEAEGAGPRKRQLKADQFATISMKLCKAYNDGRCCSKAGCPDMHRL